MVNNLVIVFILGMLLSYWYIYETAHEEMGHQVPFFFLMSLLWFIIIPIKLCFKLYYKLTRTKEPTIDPSPLPGTRPNRNGRIYPPPYIPRRGTKFKYGK